MIYHHWERMYTYIFMFRSQLPSDWISCGKNPFKTETTRGGVLYSTRTWCKNLVSLWILILQFYFVHVEWFRCMLWWSTWLRRCSYLLSSVSCFIGNDWLFPSLSLYFVPCVSLHYTLCSVKIWSWCSLPHEVLDIYFFIRKEWHPCNGYFAPSR